MARARFWIVAALGIGPAALATAQTVTVSVDPALDRRAVSPFIYGVNFGTDGQMQTLHWPVRRWGGNATTRYNWQRDISNRGSDWFFFNIPEDNPNPGQLPDNSSADVFIDRTRTG